VTSAGWSNSRLVVEAVSAEIRRLKAEGSGDIFVFGSADLASTLVANGLVDEFRFGIHPVLLGSGTPLFKAGFERTALKLCIHRC
jgi:dihydrofolate reductase